MLHAIGTAQMEHVEVVGGTNQVQIDPTTADVDEIHAHLEDLKTPGRASVSVHGVHVNVNLIIRTPPPGPKM